MSWERTEKAFEDIMIEMSPNSIKIISPKSSINPQAEETLKNYVKAHHNQIAKNQ